MKELKCVDFRFLLLVGQSRCNQPNRKTMSKRELKSLLANKETCIGRILYELEDSEYLVQSYDEDEKDDVDYPSGIRRVAYLRKRNLHKKIIPYGAYARILITTYKRCKKFFKDEVEIIKIYWKGGKSD